MIDIKKEIKNKGLLTKIDKYEELNKIMEKYIEIFNEKYYSNIFYEYMKDWYVNIYKNKSTYNESNFKSYLENRNVDINLYVERNKYSLVEEILFNKDNINIDISKLLMKKYIPRLLRNSFYIFMKNEFYDKDNTYIDNKNKEIKLKEKINDIDLEVIINKSRIINMINNHREEKIKINLRVINEDDDVKNYFKFKDIFRYEDIYSFKNIIDHIYVKKDNFIDINESVFDNIYNRYLFFKIKDIHNPIIFSLENVDEKINLFHIENFRYALENDAKFYHEGNNHKKYRTHLFLDGNNDLKNFINKLIYLIRNKLKFEIFFNVYKNYFYCIDNNNKFIDLKINFDFNAENNSFEIMNNYKADSLEEIKKKDDLIKSMNNFLRYDEDYLALHNGFISPYRIFRYLEENNFKYFIDDKNPFGLNIDKKIIYNRASYSLMIKFILLNFKIDQILEYYEE